MQFMLATVLTADGGVLCQNAMIQTDLPVQPQDPRWRGQFHVDRAPLRPPQVGDSIRIRIPTGEELPAVISGCALEDVSFHGELS